MAAWSAIDNEPTSMTNQAVLPTGDCNFADLSRGSDAPRCGCRRFWSDTTRSRSSYGINDGAWCACGHHACFHAYSAAPEVSRTGSRPRSASRSSHNRPLGTLDALRQKRPSQEDTVRWERTSSPGHVGLGLVEPSHQPGIWDVINDYQRRQVGSDCGGSSALPSTVPQSSTPSQANNHTSHTLMRQVLSVAAARGASGNVDINDTGSATEMNTPSLLGTPQFVRAEPHVPTKEASPRSPPSVGQSVASTTQPRPSRQDSGANVAARQSQRPSFDAGVERSPRHAIENPSLIELQNLYKSCAERINFLESLSYTHVPLDEVEEKFEQVDGRLISLEDFRYQVESNLPASGDDEKTYQKKRRLLPTEATTSFNSDASEGHRSSRSSSSAVSATAAVYAEYNGRIEALQQRIDLLESTFPAPAHPWRVEVVLLPWGRHLPGIWHPAGQLEDNERRDSRDEWTGAHSGAHGVFGEDRSQLSGWSTGSIQAWAENAQDWLCPKACGPNGIVFQRLWSRGLVQNIDIDLPDAHAVMQKCRTAFAHVLQPVTAPPVSSARLEYDALREPLVPLRKVRKVSRLRFLAPSEMVSSALWTPAFLDTSVFMHAKGHRRRLYLTTPEAYIQRTGDGWTWQTIKALRPHRQTATRTGPGFDGLPQDVDAEACWARHPTFDAPPYVSQSFSSNASGQSLWSTKSQASRQTVRQAHVPIPSPMVSPVSQARILPGPRRRTASIPLSHGAPSSVRSCKRRVASFETAALDSKRRRTSATSSSQRPRPGPAAATPRLSREPPSPFASDLPTDRGSENNSNRRVVTPLAYETPHGHTNTNNTALPTHTPGEGDTEPDTDILLGRDAWSWRDDEWSGRPTTDDSDSHHLLPSSIVVGGQQQQQQQHQQIAGPFSHNTAMTSTVSPGAYREQSEDLDDEVDVGHAEEVLEHLADHMRDSYTRCRRHARTCCPRCPEVEHRYSLRSGKVVDEY